MTSQLPAYTYPEERRLASVLIAHIHGLTAFAEKMDFEIISEWIKDVWLKVDETIEAYGGYIDKHFGDSVMAVWGAPFGEENDAEQAVRSALALQSTIENLDQNSQTQGVSYLKISVGINTDFVLTGYLGKRNEYAVIGETVNFADFLQQVCVPGQILISDATHRIVRGAFKFRRTNLPTSAPDRSDSTVGYIVEGTIQQPGKLRYRSEDSMETCMVGRDIEMDRLNSLCQTAVREEKTLLVLVTGEPGIGKSRLLMEFSNLLEMAETPATLISVRAFSQTKHVPFYLWKMIWTIRFGLQDSDPLEVTRQRFLREIQKLWGFQLGPASSVEAAHLIGSLIGIPYEDSSFIEKYTSRSRMKRCVEMMRELLRRMCAFRPLVFLWDDLQFADNASLELGLALLEPAHYPLPLLILGSARTEFAQHNSQWLNAAHLLELGPLPVSAEIVAGAYPSLSPYPEIVLQEIAERSDGNPYFLEELAKSLLKSGIAPRGITEEALLEHIRSLPLDSLRMMLQARLDSLSYEARAVALLASVVGRVFWVGAVFAAAQAGERLATGGLSVTIEDDVDRLVQDALRQLVSVELAFPLANTTFSEEQEYIFKHSLLRDVAYEMLPRKHLPYYHQAVAKWLESRDNADFKFMAADHYELGYEYDKAAQLYEEAAELALRQGGVREAQDLIRRAKKTRKKEKGFSPQTDPI
jgi:class 3 adenylate cyclase